MNIIKSTRFQALVALSIVIILGDYGILPYEVVTAFVTILGGHIGIRSWDRFSDKIGSRSK